MFLEDKHTSHYQISQDLNSECKEFPRCIFRMELRISDKTNSGLHLGS